MKSLSAIIPVFNEERSIARLVQELSDLPQGVLSECIFVDDGSTDHSMAILKEALKAHDLPNQIVWKKNGGKASAIRAGSSKLKTSHVVILDSDLELATSDIPRLWDAVQNLETDFVFGYRRFLAHSSFTWRYSRGNQLISNLYGVLFNEVITDIMCGYKLIPSTSLQALPYKYKKFGLEVEIAMNMWQLRQRPYEIEVSYNARTRAEGKSISIIDAIAVMFTMLIFRITHRRTK
jgi:glycosyltransferase involved in cell wall biosynthesis